MAAARLTETEKRVSAELQLSIANAKATIYRSPPWWRVDRHRSQVEWLAANYSASTLPRPCRPQPRRNHDPDPGQRRRKERRRRAGLQRGGGVGVSTGRRPVREVNGWRWSRPRGYATSPACGAFIRQRVSRHRRSRHPKRKDQFDEAPRSLAAPDNLADQLCEDDQAERTQQADPVRHRAWAAREIVDHHLGAGVFQRDPQHRLLPGIELPPSQRVRYGRQGHENAPTGDLNRSNHGISRIEP